MITDEEVQKQQHYVCWLKDMLEDPDVNEATKDRVRDRLIEEEFELDTMYALHEEAMCPTTFSTPRSGASSAGARR